MACTPEVLVSDARCLVQGMSERQLLASIACQLAVAAGEECDAASLIASSKCILEAATSDRELLAVIVWLQCQIAGG